MDWLNLDKKYIDEINGGEYDFNDFEVKSEVAKVQIDSVYLTVNDNNAMAFNIKFKKENGAFIDAQEWIRSGSDKGNKSTYTDKKGNERPLPGIVNIQHFLKIIDEDFKSIGEPQKMIMEVFGKKTEVKVFESLRGKQLIVAKQAYEDDYTGEIKIRTRIVEFMNMNGKNYKDKEMLSYWKEKFEKEPIKVLNKKVEKKETNNNAKDTLAGW